MSVFNETPTEFYDLNELFPVLNSKVGLTYVQFQKLVENTIWLKNCEDKIGVIYSYVAGGSPSQFGLYWLSKTDGGIALTPDTNFIYVMLSSGNFQKWLFRWNGTTYEPLNKDFESYVSATNFPITGISNIFYLALDTSVIYYWNGTAYVEASGTDLTNYYTKTETNGLLDEKADKDRIQNSDNTRFVDTQASGVAIDLSPSLSGGGGSETGRIKLARNFFEMYAEKIHTNQNFKYKYQIETQIDGSIKVVVEDTFPDGKGQETYSFDFAETENPNQVARIKDIPITLKENNVVVAVEDWVADTTYTDYDYKAVLTLTGMLSTYEPSVVFGLVEVETGNYASVCLAGTDTITIYAKEIPSASITLPLIKGEQL